MMFARSWTDTHTDIRRTAPPVPYAWYVAPVPEPPAEATAPPARYRTHPSIPAWLRGPIIDDVPPAPYEPPTAARVQPAPIQMPQTFAALRRCL
jgi:hypothetical protein